MNSKDLEQSVAFWKSALSATEESVATQSSHLYAQLKLPDSEIRLLLQLVPDASVSSSSTHVDIETDDLVAEVARLESLGARRITEMRRRGFVWWIMEDPSGNVFCVLEPRFQDALAATHRWDHGRTEISSQPQLPDVTAEPPTGGPSEDL